MPPGKGRAGGITAHVIEIGVITMKSEIPAQVGNYFQIRYVKLHFTLAIAEDGILLCSKASSLWTE